jgi:hypothetical protein
MGRSVILVALLSASSVFAQEDVNVDLPTQPPTEEEQPAAPERPPPAELPPILVVPPLYPPVTVVPALDQIDALEQSGHYKRTAGAVLQAAGGIIALTGAILLVAAPWDDASCAQNDNRATWVVQSYTSSGSPTGSRATQSPGCGDSPLRLAGGLTLLLGVAMILPGVAVSRNGYSELARAKALRKTHGLEWSLRPSVTAHGGNAELKMHF